MYDSAKTSFSPLCSYNKKLGGASAETDDPKWPKAFWTLHSAVKAGLRRKAECLKWWCLPCIANAMSHEGLLSRKWLNICLLMGSTEWNPYFALLVVKYLFHLLNCLYIMSCIFKFVILTLSCNPMQRGDLPASWDWPTTPCTAN